MREISLPVLSSFLYRGVIYSKNVHLQSSCSSLASHAFRLNFAKAERSECGKRSNDRSDIVMTSTCKSKEDFLETLFGPVNRSIEMYAYPLIFAKWLKCPQRMYRDVSIRLSIVITRYQDRFHSSPGLTTLRANAEFVSPFWPIARAEYWPTSLAVHVLMPNSKDVLPSELKWYLLLVSGIALPSFNQVTEKFVILLVTILLPKRKRRKGKL